MPRKPKTNQPQTPDKVQGRDFFQTPNYAVDLLVPFIPKQVIWESACGDGKIVQRLTEKGFSVYPSDIRKASGWVNNHIHNFIIDEEPINIYFKEKDYCIITNPPFSLKRKFYEKCLEYKVPFALLVPADYSGWIIKACEDGAEKIIPTRRIDYITPDTLNRIHEGEIWKSIQNQYKEEFSSLNDLKENRKLWLDILSEHDDFYNYKLIDDVPMSLLAEYSTSQFHSMWLTSGFNIGKSETFVELSLKEKKENI